MKKYHWKGGKLDAETALGLTVEWWDWIADNPDKPKHEWPRLIGNGGDVEFSGCYLCREKYLRVGVGSCASECLLGGKWGNLEEPASTCESNGALYERWRETQNPAYARMIADLACNELRKLKGGR